MRQTVFKKLDGTSWYEGEPILPIEEVRHLLENMTGVEFFKATYGDYRWLWYYGSGKGDGVRVQLPDIANVLRIENGDTLLPKTTAHRLYNANPFTLADLPTEYIQPCPL